MTLKLKYDANNNKATILFDTHLTLSESRIAELERAGILMNKDSYNAGNTLFFGLRPNLENRILGLILKELKG